jgi:hypothetical protein
LPKPLKSFRFNPQTYNSFKQLASQNGYTTTAALEKFMETALQHGLTFPSAAKAQDAETEARIMLTWIQQDRYWYNITGDKELSTIGRLLELLPKITNADLKQEVEEALKRNPNK